MANLGQAQFAIGGQLGTGTIRNRGQAQNDRPYQELPIARL